MCNIKFVKPSHKRPASTEGQCSSSHESSERQLQKKIHISGPQDTPHLPPETLYKSLFQLVPGACLFTIVAKPELTENQLDSYDQNTAVGGALSTVDNNEQICDDAHVLGDVQSSVLSSNEHANAMNSDSTMVTEQALSLQNSTQTEATSHDHEAVNVVRSDMASGDQTNQGSVTCDQTREMAASIINSELCSNEATLPIPLLQHFKEKLKSITEKDLCTIAQHLYFSITITAEESCAIERGTQHQRECQDWFKHREGRLTASSFHSIWTLRAQQNLKIYCRGCLII